MEERRRAPRFGCIGQRSLSLMFGEKLIGVVRNFSRGGLSFSSLENFDEKRSLNFELDLSGFNRRVPVEFQILWKRQFGNENIYGASFTNITTEDKSDILDSLYQDWRNTISSDTLLH